MSRNSLLVLSILLFSVSAIAGARSSNSQSVNPVLMADNASVDTLGEHVQNFQLGRTQSFEMGPDDVCYRIRAYIFKRDDDHAPQLVRSTTCGPRAPHAKDAKWPDAKLVPAR